MPTPVRQSLLRRSTYLAIAVGVVLGSTQPAAAQGKGLPLVRDAEIENLMRIYTRPIFKVAGINETAVNVYLVRQPSINAFVAGGQRIFINTGLLTQAKNPNEVIGVLAHETGHIAGGHLARMGQQLDKASTQAIIGMLLGAAAMVGGAASGSGEAAQAGQGIMLGTQGLAQRNLLAYARAQESAADQAAIGFLDATGQSARGMITLFQKLANQSLASLTNVNPYVLSHPMPLERIRNLEAEAKKSPFFDRADSKNLVLRHSLMQAKLLGFLGGAQMVFQKYPTSDKSLPARYARAIASFRIGDLKNSLPEIDALIKAQPKYAYFWELKGQALLEGGRAREAVTPLKHASELSQGNGLINMLLAQALLQSESRIDAEAALKALRAAKRTESETPSLHTNMALAFARLGNLPLADLATAEAALRRGDTELAGQKAKAASTKLKRGSPDWVRANDILNFIDQKKT